MFHSARGIPTRYGSRTYRSRLEARWAAFFADIYWRAEYEPFDLDGWIPDFALSGAGGKVILAEVKPIFARDEDVCRKISRAAADQYELLLLGIGPFDSTYWDGPALGWLYERHGGWDEAIIGLSDKTGRYDFFHASGSYGYQLSGEGDGTHHIKQASPPAVRQLWAAAGDAVQWRAP
jgi:hypothetical protein